MARTWGLNLQHETGDASVKSLVGGGGGGKNIQGELHHDRPFRLLCILVLL